MRKLVSYSLFFLVAWQIIGFVAYFEFSHYHLKKEIKLVLKQGVPRNKLVIFEFDKNQLEELIWLKKNEFKYQGNLFDVVRSHETAEGKTYMECISDTQETLLFKKLEQTVSINLGDDRDPTPLSNWLKTLHFPLILAFFELKIPNFDTTSLPKPAFHFEESVLHITAKIESPPPENA